MEYLGGGSALDLVSILQVVHKYAYIFFKSNIEWYASSIFNDLKVYLTIKALSIMAATQCY